MKNILFDLDGTLLDSGEGIMNSASYALDYFHINYNQEDLKLFVGPPLKETFEKYKIKDTHKAIQVFRDYYLNKGQFQNKVYDGIIHLLNQLVLDGYTLYVATSKPEVMAKKILKHYEMDHYFTKICGASMDEKISKKADIIEQVKKHANHNPMIMIGDTVYDMIGAASHQITSIGVTWGYGLENDMRNHGAHAIAHNTQELYTLLLKL